MNTKCSHL